MTGLPPKASLPSIDSTGLALATTLVAGWMGSLGYALFLHPWTASVAWTTPLLVAWLCWLSVGLFIVAHDAMHGSLAPKHPRINRAVGRLCLALYAGFSLDRFIAGHLNHHRHPGTADDPDFVAGNACFWRWYGQFMRSYVGWQEVGGIAAMMLVLIGVLGASPARAVLFWALPAVLSSLQLFAFGTWLPHRRTEHGFADHHNARSNNYGYLVSLMTCFHFGYHREHHLRPDAPWWALPAVRRAHCATEALNTSSAGSTAAREEPVSLWTPGPRS